MRYTPEMIERFGLVPYAIYGGVVYSFKVPSATGDKVYPAELIEPILIAAQIEADKLIESLNAATKARILACL